MSILAFPVPVTLGGRSFLAAEFRVADILALEAWAAQQSPDAFEQAAFDLYHMPQTAEWKRLLWSVLEAVEAADETFQSRLATPEGIVRQLALCLHRGNPATDETEVTAALEAGRETPLVADTEIGRILRVAWGEASLDAIRGLIDGPGQASGRTDWPALWYRYVTTVTGPAPKFEDLSMGQLRIWLSGGRDAEEGPEAMEVAMRRAIFWEGVEEKAGSGEDQERSDSLG